MPGASEGRTLARDSSFCNKWLCLCGPALSWRPDCISQCRHYCQQQDFLCLPVQSLWSFLLPLSLMHIISVFPLYILLYCLKKNKNKKTHKKNPQKNN